LVPRRRSVVTLITLPNETPKARMRASEWMRMGASDE
jgi:hypothetical protein